jgi:SAM-dependent methyltransferase
MLHKPVRLDPRTNSLDDAINRALDAVERDALQEKVCRLLMTGDRNLTTLREIAELLPKRTGVSYDADAIESRAARRINSALAAVAKFSTRASRVVLDIGCARAENALRLKSPALEKYIGLDVDDQHFPDSEDLEAFVFLLKASAEEIPLPSNSVDLAISFNVFEHIPEPSKALKEIVRVLRPGGIFYTTFGPPFNAAGGPHLTRYIDLPYMHHLFAEDVIGELTKRSHAFYTVNRKPLSYYRDMFFAENSFRLVEYREQVDGRGFWVLAALSELRERFSDDELAVNAITAVVQKAEV